MIVISRYGCFRSGAAGFAQNSGSTTPPGRSRIVLRVTWRLGIVGSGGAGKSSRVRTRDDCRQIAVNDVVVRDRAS